MAERKKFQRLGGGRCRFQFVDPLTGRREDFFGSEAQCEAKRQAIEHQRNLIKLGADPAELRAREPSALDKRTLDDLFKQFIRGSTKSSARVYLNHWQARISPHLGNVCPWELTAEKLYDWVAKLADADYAPNTIKASAELVLMVARRAHLQTRPWEGFRMRRAEPKRQRRALRNLEEVEAVLLAARAVDQTHWQKGEEAFLAVAICVAVLTGLRNAEMAGLSWRDLYLDAQDPGAPALITIARQAPRGWQTDKHGRPNGKKEPDAPPKGKKVCTLVLHQEAAEAMRLHREQMKRAGLYDQNGPVFPDSHGYWRTNGEVIRPEQVARIVTAAGLPYENFTTHELRHTFGTLTAHYIVRAGGDIRQVQAQLRHGDLKTSWTYVHAVTAGLAPSAIPALKVHIVPAITAGEAENHCPKLLPKNGDPTIVGLGQLSALRSSSIRVDPVVVKLKKRTLREIAEEICRLPEDGRPAIPEEVRDLARAAYQRAYNRAKGRKKPAITAGRRANAAVEVAWATALRRAKSKLGQDETV